MPEKELLQASTHVDAGPAEVFAFLCDPANHEKTEPTDWVRDAIDREPITATGQTFGINMFLELVGGHYEMHNLVTVFEQDRALAWLPGTLDLAGNHDPGGWWWRYDIEPENGGSQVTITYDWTETPEAFRKQVGGMPPFRPGYLDESLASLAANVGS